MSIPDKVQLTRVKSKLNTYFNMFEPLRNKPLYKQTYLDKSIQYYLSNRILTLQLTEVKILNKIRTRC